MKRVLIVEDNDVTRASLCELLDHAGYECTAVGTFHEAAAMLRKRPPDLLITDIRLQQYNGLQLVLMLTSRRLPAIVITGFADDVLASEAIRHGAAYLVKPVSPNRLLALTDALLAESSRTNVGQPARSKPH